MFRITAAALCLCAAAFFAPAWSEPTCRYAHIVDPCAKKAFVLNAGATEATLFVALGEGPAGAHAPLAVDHSTVPETGAFHSFVSQGPFLRVIRPSLIDISSYDPDQGVEPSRTLDLAADLGLNGIELAGLHAADPLEIDGLARYPLYAAATSRGTADQPWIVVFDQEALVRVPFEPADTLWAVIPLCPQDPDCAGEAVDVAAGARLPDGSQEIFVSVLAQVGGQPVQRFVRVVFHESGAHELSLYPWNDEGLPFGGSEPGALGLDYDSLGLAAYGVLQTSSAVSDLHTGLQSCALGPGDPTDVATWGPGAELDIPYVQFVTAATGTGAGVLFGYPEGVCPVAGETPLGDPLDTQGLRTGTYPRVSITSDTEENSSLFIEFDGNLPRPVGDETLRPLEITPGALGLPVGERPLALALSSRTDWRPWIYTANGSGGISAVRVEIRHDPLEGDTMEVLGQIDMPLGECPSAISFRDEAYTQCIQFGLNRFDIPSAPRPGDSSSGDYDPWDP